MEGPLAYEPHSDWSQFDGYAERLRNSRNEIENNAILQGYNPTHEYPDAGTYTVTLTVDNARGSDSETEVDYIFVIAAGSATLWVCDSRNSTIYQVTLNGGLLASFHSVDSARSSVRVSRLCCSLSSFAILYDRSASAYCPLTLNHSASPSRAGTV